MVLDLEDMHKKIQLYNVHIDKEPPKPKTEKGTPVVNKEIKVGRNEKCPCGSGKKYKNCCGKDKK